MKIKGISIEKLPDGRWLGKILGTGSKIEIQRNTAAEAWAFVTTYAREAWDWFPHEHKEQS